MADTSGPRSGKHGMVSAYGWEGTYSRHIRNWNLNLLEQPENRVHSASRSGHERIVGVRDWNGSFEGFGPDPFIFPGNDINITLYAGPKTGVYGTAGQTYVGTAIVDSITINWNWQPTQSINWTANFSGDGVLAYASDDYIYDDSVVCDPSMCDLVFEYQDFCADGTPANWVDGQGYSGTGETFVDWENIESATLTITSDNLAIVNSSTGCWTERVAGNLDWTLSIVDQEEYLIPTYDVYYLFRLYSSLTTYWELAWGLLQDISNIRVDIESGAIVTKSNNFAMAGRVCCAAGQGKIGVITRPDGVIEWPIGTGT